MPEQPAEPSTTSTALKPTADAAPSCPVHEPGAVIAERYEVERRFEGGMGYVYITLDRSQNLRFAIKQPKAWMLAEPALLARVAREADAWTGLGMHPHIAYCYFVRSLDGVPHLFVEYVDGGNLREWIAAGRGIDYRASLDLAIQCCQGMERAHGWGMVHRDLKPENILVSRDGQAKITDFGLVGDLGIREDAAGVDRPEASALATQCGMQMGTPAYMAPEQWRDPRRRSAEAPDGVDCDSDVYSFGVCLWEMVCGRLPYPSALADAELPDPHRSRRDLPASLGQLLRDVVARDRRQRPADFGVLRKRLNAVYRELFHDDAPAYRIDLPDTGAAELNNQGYSYAELGKPEQALACFRQAVEKDPTQPQAVYNLALRQWRAAEIDDLEVLRRLQNCERNPRNAPETLAELTALIHAERADWEAAQARLQDYPGRFTALFGDREAKPQCLRSISIGYEFMATAVAMTADGRWALSGSRDKTLKLWDLETGECLRTLAGHTDEVTAVAVTGDGRRALSGSRDKTLKLWDLDTGECLRTLAGHTDWVRIVALTDNGRRALSGSRDQTLKFWDLETGECLHTFGYWITTMAVAGDGRRALSVSKDRFRLWDLDTGGCLALPDLLHTQWTGYSMNTTTVALTRDGRQALSGGSDKTLRFWNLETGECLRTLTGHTESVNTVAMTGDGRWALSGSADKTLKLWDLTSGRCLCTLTRDKWSISTVAVTVDGRRALSTGDSNLKLWDLPPVTYQVVLQLAPPQSFAEKQRACIALQQALAQTDTRLARNDFQGAHAALLTAWQEMGFRPDAAIQERYGRLIRHGRISALRAIYPVKTLVGHRDSVRTVAMMIDGRRALSGGTDTLKLWDLETGECLPLRALNEGRNAAIAMTSDGQRALSGTENKTLKFFDLKWDACLRTLTGHTDSVNAVAMTGDGQRALSGSRDKTLKLWDLEMCVCLRTLTGHTAEVRAVVVTNDGRRTLSGSHDKTLKLWDLETGECLRTLTGHTDSVNAVAMTADGRRALSGSYDQTLKLWDLETGECLRTLTGHIRIVNAVALTGDGRRGLSGSADKTFRLWDLETGKCLQTLTGHTDSINAVAVTADWQRVLSGSADKTLILWQLAWELEFPEAPPRNNPSEEQGKTIALKKGRRLSLSQEAPDLKKVTIGLGWTLRVGDGVECDVDASTFLLDLDSKVRSDADIVFYNQPQSACGSVQLTDADPGDGDKRALVVDLDRVPADVWKITFTLTIHEAEQRRQNFGQVNNAYLRLVDADTNREVARYDLGEDATTETALIFGELYRHGGEWRFSAVGQRHAGGLAALCQRYGVEV